MPLPSRSIERFVHALARATSANRWSAEYDANCAIGVDARDACCDNGAFEIGGLGGVRKVRRWTGPHRRSAMKATYAEPALARYRDSVTELMEAGEPFSAVG